MKRLLLPLLAALALPTAVNANLFSSDIIFETNLGEKYIVKKKAVSSRSNTLQTVKYLLSGEMYRNIAKDYNGDNPEVWESNWTWKAERTEAKYPELKPEIDKYSSNEIVSYEIYYQPIFQNLNNFKIAMEEKKIICINPKFKNENFPKAYHKMTAESIELNVLDEKVCEKYAKFFK